MPEEAILVGIARSSSVMLKPSCVSSVSCVSRSHHLISSSFFLLVAGAYSALSAQVAANFSFVLTTVEGNFSGPYAVAMDGSGHVHLSDTCHFQRAEVPACCLSTSHAVSQFAPFRRTGSVPSSQSARSTFKTAYGSAPESFSEWMSKTTHSFR
jgi:hypothetical protein